MIKPGSIFSPSNLPKLYAFSLYPKNILKKSHSKMEIVNSFCVVEECGIKVHMRIFSCLYTQSDGDQLYSLDPGGYSAGLRAGLHWEWSVGDMQATYLHRHITASSRCCVDRRRSPVDAAFPLLERRTDDIDQGAHLPKTRSIDLAALIAVKFSV